MPNRSRTTTIGAVLEAEPMPTLDIEGLNSRRLSDREVQIVRALVKIFASGFAEHTMADLAVGAGCSLRSLYRLAPSRTELVLVVVNQSLRQIAYEARKSARDAVTPLAAVALYVHRTTRSVAKLSPEHARDLAAIPEVQLLSARFSAHRVSTIDRLLQQAVLTGEISEVDTRTFAVAADALVIAFTASRERSQKVAIRQVDSAVAAMLSGLVHHRWNGDAMWEPGC